ncbi:MAG: leucine-rich repeat domain-containing protein [Mucilaginibacter sp.]|nr:leucine-rich repeat domain-containing protein [Mucilaginibacter sp.]
MPKSNLKLFLFLLIFPAYTVFAQNTQKVFNKYIDGHIFYDLVSFHTQSKFLSAQKTPHEINIQINDVTDLKAIISKGLQDKVYGLEIMNAQRPNLSIIFETLTKFPNLVFIRIRDEFFSSPSATMYQLPSTIQFLQQLQGISFSYTRKLDMEDAINKLASLKNLHTISFEVINNKLPASITKLVGLNSIKASSLNLEGIDLSTVKWQTVMLSGSAPKAGPDVNTLTNLSKVKFLKTLKLEFCTLGDASVLSRFNQLATLNLHSCYADKSIQISDEVGKLKNLTNLSFRFFSDTTQTIYGIKKLVKLKYLSLVYFPSLATHPEQLNIIKRFNNLDSIALSINKMSTLPNIFESLIHLKKVSVDQNNLTELPLSLFNLPQVEYIYAGSNKLRKLPESQRYGCEKLKKLDLTYNALTSLPGAITHLTKLVTLEASASKISSLPDGWRSLKNLKNINLSKNRLTTFPAEWFELPGLETINVNNNDLTSLPDVKEIKYSLNTLNVGLNRLTALPDHIGNFTELAYFSAEGNILNELPFSLGNCKKLRSIELQSVEWRSIFDIEKPENQQFSRISRSITENNSFKTLPPGLKNTPLLETLTLSGNASLNSKSIFDIILSMARKGLRANLYNCNITELPANDKWATMTFYDLDLRNNKLVTLPAQFALTTAAYEINLNGNPLNLKNSQTTLSIQNKADMKILFDELGIDIKTNVVPNRDYATALTKVVTNLYYAEKWQQGVNYAQKSFEADSIEYNRNISWDQIGTCRFKTGDYNGAIKDFDRYLTRQNTRGFRVINFIEPVIRYKVKSHLALGQPTEAAKTYEYYYKEFDGESALQQAAVIYKSIGDEKQFNRLIDTALSNEQKTMDYNQKSKQPSLDIALNHAELLLIAGKPDQVAELLNKDYSYPSKSSLITKGYLTATAQYLIDSQQFESLKKSLSAAVAVNGKITNWDFEMFNTWLEFSGFSKTKQQQLLDLQNIAK